MKVLGKYSFILYLYLKYDQETNQMEEIEI